MAIPPDMIRFLQQYFDKILVVSVPRFTDRHARVKERLQGLSFDFFWGADKLLLDLEKAKNDGTYDEAGTKKRQRQGKPLSQGELACSLSHRLVYKAIIEHGWKKTLVLEDDVWPLFDNMPLLEEAMNELPLSWDLVYLGYLKHEKVTAALKRKQLFYKFLSGMGLMKWNYTMASNLLPRYFSKHLKKAGFHDCTHAYAISLEGAGKLLKEQTPVVYRADDLLSHTILQGKLSAFVTEPKFFDQEDFHVTETDSKIKETD